MVGRIVTGNARGDVDDFRRGTRHADAGLQTNVGKQIAVVGIQITAVGVEANPDVAVGILATGRDHRQPKVIGHDASDRERHAIQQHLAADERRVAAEPQEQRARDHRAVGIAEPLSDQRRDTELSHQRDGHRGPGDVLWLAGRHQIETLRLEPAEYVEALR